LWVHTRNDCVITINPTLRIPRSFPRFVGVMEKLLSEGVIKGEDDVLLELEKQVRLQDLLYRLKVDKVVKFSPTEEITTDLSELVSGEVALVVGGFSKGNFLSEFKHDVVVSVYKEELTSWAVIAEVMKFV
jgi:rRNA small subunit pseudouridine methyltransferase Nep1